jgi:hypothetical protein
MAPRLLMPAAEAPLSVSFGVQSHFGVRELWKGSPIPTEQHLSFNIICRKWDGVYNIKPSVSFYGMC